MSRDWQQTFRERMRRFEGQHKPPKDAVAVSIKIRVSSGCFHREHSSRAYALIDNYLSNIAPDEVFSFEEHESGPELLVYVAAVTAGISLAKSVIDLIVAIIKARSEGIEKGDHPTAPLELIIRRVNKKGEFKEEALLRIDHRNEITREIVEKYLKGNTPVLLKEDNKVNKPLKKIASKKRRAR
jgi:hypothetical protein